MAITQGMCASFKQELMEGVHDFTSNTFRIALYANPTADLDPLTTTAYTTTGEVSGAGYTAGGEALTVVNGAVTLSVSTAFVDFGDVTISGATFSADGALIYNASAVGNPAVAVIDFGETKTASNGNFEIQFPTADASNAIIRIA